MFTSLNLKNVVLKLNNRKILEGLYNYLTPKFSFIEFCISLDKIEKSGIDVFVFLEKIWSQSISIFKSLFSKSISSKKFKIQFSSLFNFKSQL